MTKQTYIPGIEPPDEQRNPDVDEAIGRWYDARSAQKRAAEVTAVVHDKLLETMAEAGIEKYPFTEPGTDKRKILVATAPRKARAVKAPTRQDREDAAFERDRQDGAGPVVDLTQAVRDAIRTAVSPDTRVSVGWADGQRIEVPAADPTDPFAATRGQMSRGKPTT